MTHIKYTLLLLIIGANTAFAQLRLEVSAPKEVDINEDFFKITYTIASTDTRDFTAPPIKGLDLLAPPSMSVMSGMSYSSQNGRSTSQSYGTTTYTIMLAPLSKGSYTIPAATVRVGNTLYKSKAVTIRISGNGTRSPQQPNNNGDSNNNEQLRPTGTKISESDLYMRGALGRKQIYEQEAVPLTYKFYERPGVGLNTVSLNKKPDFKGMVSQDIPVRSIEANMERVNGETYRTGVVQQYVIFPQQTGHITIPGLEFNCVVIQQEEGISAIDAFFNGGGHIGIPIVRKAPDLTIDVKPLPKPQPAGFSGGVGQFHIKGELLPPMPKTNEMVTYRLTISGSGNLQLLSAPTITFPADFETYSPKSTDKTKILIGGVTGEMIFDYTFVPRNVGEYTVPAVNFTYFDPASAAYKTVSAPALPLTVEKGERSEADLQRERELRNSDIHDAQKTTGKFHKNQEQYLWWGQPTYWLCLAGILIAFVLSVVMLRNHKRAIADVATHRRNKAGREASRRLKLARKLLSKGEKEKFHTELSHALGAFIADKLSVEPGSLSNERIQQELTARGISENEYAPFLTLLETCEFARFAPETTNNAGEEMLRQASESISTLNRLIKNADKKAQQ